MDTVPILVTMIVLFSTLFVCIICIGIYICMKDLGPKEKKRDKKIVENKYSLVAVRGSLKSRNERIKKAGPLPSMKSSTSKTLTNERITNTVQKTNPIDNSV
jgi:hypothetical protein